MNPLRKTVTTLLTGSALAVMSSQASAITLVSNIDYQGAPVSINGTTAVKNWADMEIDLGWMHTTKWYTLSVSTPGDVRIKLTDTSAAGSSSVSYAAGPNAGKTIDLTWNGGSTNPAFSVWRFAGAAGAGSSMTSASNPDLLTSPLATHYDGTGTQHNDTMGYNQVEAPGNNNSAFLAPGGVDGFVGYANAGDIFVNGNGNAVGHGSAGSAYGADTGGHKFAMLDLFGLQPGNYLLAVGANCINLANCGLEVTQKTVRDTATGQVLSSETNPANTWGTGSYTLSVAAVPVPAAFWLFGSALAGLGIVGRRRDQTISAT